MKIMLRSKAVVKKDVFPYRNLPMFLRNPHDYIALHCITSCVLLIFYYGILLDILLSVRQIHDTVWGQRYTQI
jgi:hypothetical protein